MIKLRGHVHTRPLRGSTKAPINSVEKRGSKRREDFECECCDGMHRIRIYSWFIQVFITLSVYIVQISVWTLC